MHYEYKTKNEVAVFSLVEEKVGYPGLEAFQKALHAAVDQGARKMILDLSRVKFLDSFGIGMLAGLNRKLVNLGGSLKLCGVNDRVMMSLTITRLDQLLDIFRDEEAALKSYGGERGPE